MKLWNITSCLLNRYHVFVCQQLHCTKKVTVTTASCCSFKVPICFQLWKSRCLTSLRTKQSVIFFLLLLLPPDQNDCRCPLWKTCASSPFHAGLLATGAIHTYWGKPGSIEHFGNTLLLNAGCISAAPGLETKWLDTENPSASQPVPSYSRGIKWKCFPAGQAPAPGQPPRRSFSPAGSNSGLRFPSPPPAGIAAPLRERNRTVGSTRLFLVLPFWQRPDALSRPWVLTSAASPRCPASRTRTTPRPRCWRDYRDKGKLRRRGERGRRITLRRPPGAGGVSSGRRHSWTSLGSAPGKTSSTGLPYSPPREAEEEGSDRADAETPSVPGGGREAGRAQRQPRLSAPSLRRWPPPLPPPPTRAPSPRPLRKLRPPPRAPAREMRGAAVSPGPAILWQPGRPRRGCGGRWARVSLQEMQSHAAAVPSPVWSLPWLYPRCCCEVCVLPCLTSWLALAPIPVSLGPAVKRFRARPLGLFSFESSWVLWLGLAAVFGDLKHRSASYDQRGLVMLLWKGAVHCDSGRWGDDVWLFPNPRKWEAANLICDFWPTHLADRSAS